MCQRCHPNCPCNSQSHKAGNCQFPVWSQSQSHKRLQGRIFTVIENSLTHSLILACLCGRCLPNHPSKHLPLLGFSASFWGAHLYHFFMSSVHLLVGRPFLLLPSSLASNMCLSKDSCLFRWRKYDSFLTLMLFNNQSWPTFSSFGISVFFSFCYPWYSEYPPIAFCFKSVDFLFICCCQLL